MIGAATRAAPGGVTVISTGFSSVSQSGAVIDALQNLFQDNRIKTTDCATGVSGNAVIVKKISLPQMSEEELAELEERVQDYAARLARQATGAIARIKRCVNTGIYQGTAKGLAEERRAVLENFESPDVRKAVFRSLDFWLNLGVDGVMLLGAFGAYYTVLSTNSLLLGVLFGIAVGAAMAGAAGLLYALLYRQVFFLMGFIPGIKAFTAAVLGGIGDVTGAALGGLFLGIAESLFPNLVLDGLGIPAPYQLRDALAFIMLVLVLIFRPTGILGERLAVKKA